MYDKLEALESALYALDDAISAVKELGAKYSNDLNCLEIIKGEYQGEHEAISAKIREEEAREQRALEREYWRSAM